MRMDGLRHRAEGSEHKRPFEPVERLPGPSVDELWIGHQPEHARDLTDIDADFDGEREGFGGHSFRRMAISRMVGAGLMFLDGSSVEMIICAFFNGEEWSEC